MKAKTAGNWVEDGKVQNAMSGCGRRCALPSDVNALFWAMSASINVNLDLFRLLVRMSGVCIEPSGKLW